ncbi:MAG: UDP-N-acetylmuramate dehydrogenase [Clostridiales bacterium]|nr:UDP-N-acetylmuramate dehydrogenase [Clostridiales bacterium]
MGTKDVGLGVKLSGFTTFRIGGAADGLLRADTVGAFIGAWRNADFERKLILGRGSNVLVSDSGFRGLAIIARFGAVEFFDGYCVAEAGADMAALSARYYAAGLGGLEWACSLPGTVGGAVAGNSGAFGSSVADALLWADVLTDGGLARLGNSECGFAYRKGVTAGPVIRAAFGCHAADRRTLGETRARYIRRRRDTQPAGRSAGSFFKAGTKPAGFFIESAGLKGLRVGGAQVSVKHANFIINTGGATAADVSALADIIKAEVLVRFGERLEEEIKFIGEF